MSALDDRFTVENYKQLAELINKGLKIYLAGPMSGIPNNNFEVFDTAAAHLREIGYQVFNPADNDRKMWGSLENIAKYANYRDCLRADLNWILDHAEAIALLPGWDKSRGANIEKQLSEILKLKVIYLKDPAYNPPV